MRLAISAALVIFLSAGAAEAKKRVLKPKAVAPADNSRRTDAEAEADKATIAFKLGRFEEALAGYSHAYELFQASGLLFNIGQCHRQIGDHTKAVFFFDSYLRENAYAKNADIAKGLRDDELKKDADQRAVTAQRAAPTVLKAAPVYDANTATLPSVTQQETPVYGKWWFWTAIGGGAAVIAVVTAAIVIATGQPSGSLGLLDRRQ